MMFIETETVVAELIDQFPRIEVLGVSADGDLGFEMPARERIGQFGARLKMVELLTVRQQVEDEDFHGTAP